ncbi:MAG: hypothetical protein ABFS37_07130 [Acidobacteriota bacterium]
MGRSRIRTRFPVAVDCRCPCHLTLSRPLSSDAAAAPGICDPSPAFGAAPPLEEMTSAAYGIGRDSIAGALRSSFSTVDMAEVLWVVFVRLGLVENYDPASAAGDPLFPWSASSALSDLLPEDQGKRVESPVPRRRGALVASKAVVVLSVRGRVGDRGSDSGPGPVQRPCLGRRRRPITL